MVLRVELTKTKVRNLDKLMIHRKGLPSVHILRQLAEAPRPRHNKSPDLVNEILREPLMKMMIIATGSKVPKPREKVKAAFTGWL